MPNRSTGNPIVPLFRVPTPGSQPQHKYYVDPVTIPAGDIKGNPYYKRDYRRNYPQTSSFSQVQIAGLLTLGSEQAPRIAAGDAGQQSLTKIEEGSVSLAEAIKSSSKSIINGEVLGADGQPPVAPSFVKKTWKILEEPEHGMYTSDYPCRIFT